MLSFKSNFIILKDLESTYPKLISINNQIENSILKIEFNLNKIYLLTMPFLYCNSD